MIVPRTPVTGLPASSRPLGAARRPPPPRRAMTPVSSSKPGRSGIAAIIEVPVLARVATTAWRFYGATGDRRVVVDTTLLPLGASIEFFALQAVGEALGGDGIRDGDVVVLRRSRTAARGALVVARLGDATTLGRLGALPGGVPPSARRATCGAIVRGREFEVLGIVVAVLRRVAARPTRARRTAAGVAGR